MISASTRLLCLDTSTPAARVAVVDGAGVAIARAEATAERHSTHVLRLVDDVLRAASLRPADLDAIACGAGPGSFTGLRVGLAVAKGLALATDRPLLLVSSLRALAIDVAREPAAAGAPFVIPCIDAGKGEVYACAVAASDPVGDGEHDPWRLAPAALAARLGAYPGAIVAGNGAERHAAALDAALPAGVRRMSIDGPTALAIAALALARFARGEADDLDKAVPAYGRPPDITKKKPVSLG
ncbi:MAG TPA: tRNA (adenosine(37)-N6)-threonylcarbamoyltransferase complex dimerization subunit type 1 TsaB [Polyangia bacterium]|jgi:tRNA threonylcarbamoyladenosine biosynthesis protein TsaB|nr:tRNA (adenosine(37)-N6)-threonylcarbamoyltransferase complex dimerization subunit type 1 TsaB [Polyangia bacterium]